MTKIAVCPDFEHHDRFIASATVQEDWVVDRRGNWQSSAAVVEVLNGPSHDEVWECIECGAAAIFIDEEENLT